MPKTKTLDDLREHLFATLESLRDKQQPMDLERAKAISEVAQTVINSAKAEVEYAKAIGRSDLMLPVFGEQKALPAPGGNGGTPGITTHRMRG
jgi:hypothetical protein